MYELRFERDMLKMKGDAFQDFFSTVMELAHPGDFIRMRPWGKLGDRKNDGFVRSDRHLFQVYAPNEMDALSAVKKIKEDYEGAVRHWETHFDHWTFVHNSLTGIGPHILQTLLELGKGAPPRTLKHLGPPELRLKVFALSAEDLAKLLGEPWTPPPPSTIRFEEIHALLRHVAPIIPVEVGAIAPVPPGKLDANGFSPNSRMLVNLGRQAAPRVAMFLEQYKFDPELGSRAAQRLKGEYARLKEEGLEPNAIFSRLFAFISGHQPESEAAALAILVHFFDACDIFEAPLMVN